MLNFRPRGSQPFGEVWRAPCALPTSPPHAHAGTLRPHNCSSCESPACLVSRWPGRVPSGSADECDKRGQNPLSGVSSLKAGPRYRRQDWEGEPPGGQGSPPSLDMEPRPGAETPPPRTARGGGHHSGGKLGPFPVGALRASVRGPGEREEAGGTGT